MNIDFYRDLEKKYKVKYPSDEHATYRSMLNFSDDLHKPFQRWCRYKEGFSIEMVSMLIKKYNLNPEGTILDPFLGSGSTIVGANLMGLNGVGFEVNPFSAHLAKCKTDVYTKHELEELKKCALHVVNKALDENIAYELPQLSISHKIFNNEIEGYYLRVREAIKSLNVSDKVKSVLLLGWVSKVENFSNYRKAGNGLKVKKYKKPVVLSKENIRDELLKLYTDMITDIEEYKNKRQSVIYNDSCLNMTNHIGPGTVSGVIFSPPYANCFDYTEIYKMELWFGEYVKTYADLKKLRHKSLRSNLNGLLKDDVIVSSDSLVVLLEELKSKSLWDKRIPQMLSLYFSDMFRVLEHCFTALEDGGFCAIVIGNSSYSNVVFPTDLLLAEYAERIGFKVDEIFVDRYIITSSQQYDETRNLKDYLRESIVCLQKK